MTFVTERFFTRSQNDVRVARILASIFEAIDPALAVRNFLASHPLPEAKRIFLFGLGKAACAMANACAEQIEFTDSLIITKSASTLNPKLAAAFEGDHPVPGGASLEAGRKALKFLSQLKKNDLLICLISGGGSALMAAPIIPLNELQSLTTKLLASGVPIDEINTVRRHLDSLKGGGVAQAAKGARIISLILSDVVSDSLEAIASGPTAPDPSTRKHAAALVSQIVNTKYKFRETLKANDPIFKRIENHIIASNDLALNGALRQAKREGFDTEIIRREMHGEARDVAKQLVDEFKIHDKKLPRPFCLLAGGETTVTVKGNGKGGRNQELALTAGIELAGMKNVMLVSIATDGEDGSTDAAGAAVTGESVRRAEALGISAADSLSRNDAYHFFESLGDLIRIGSSGTNVNDVTLLIAF